MGYRYSQGFLPGNDLLRNFNQASSARAQRQVIADMAAVFTKELFDAALETFRTGRSQDSHVFQRLIEKGLTAEPLCRSLCAVEPVN